MRRTNILSPEGVQSNNANENKSLNRKNINRQKHKFSLAFALSVLSFFGTIIPILFSYDNKHSNGNITGKYIIEPSEKLLCTTEKCFQDLVAKDENFHKIWPMNERDNWCTSIQENTTDSTNLWKGLLFVKVHKSASTSLASMVLNINRKYKCSIQYKHRKADNYGLKLLPDDKDSHNTARRHSDSFLFGPVRHPATRALSALYYFEFREDKYGKNPVIEDDLVMSKLSSHSMVMPSPRAMGFTYWFLNPFLQASSSQGLKEISLIYETYLQVQRIIQQYDFLYVYDRVEESLVVFATITNLELEDIIITILSKAKKSGSYEIRHWGSQKGKCFYMNSPNMTPRLQSYFALTKKQRSSEVKEQQWLIQNFGDYLLYEAANKSLDKTWDHLSQELGFDMSGRLKKLKRLVNIMLQKLDESNDEVCTSFWGPAGVGCTNDGKLNTSYNNTESCFKEDYGCGYKCYGHILDSLDDEIKMW